MIKIVSTFRLRPDRPPDESSAYYLERHVPLVHSILDEVPGVLGYVQNRVVRADSFDHNGTEPHRRAPLFDWLVEFWYADRQARVAQASHPRMPEVLADHPNFMHVDTERSLEYYVAAEHVALWDPAVRAAQGA